MCSVLLVATPAICNVLDAYVVNGTSFPSITLGDGSCVTLFPDAAALLATRGRCGGAVVAATVIGCEAQVGQEGEAGGPPDEEGGEGGRRECQEEEEGG